VKIKLLSFSLLIISVQNNVFGSETLTIDPEAKAAAYEQQLSSHRSTASTNTETPTPSSGQSQLRSPTPKKIPAQRTNSTPPSSPGDELNKKHRLPKRRLATAPSKYPNGFNHDKYIDHGIDRNRDLTEINLNEWQTDLEQHIIRRNGLGLNQLPESWDPGEKDTSAIHEIDAIKFIYLQHCGNWDLEIPKNINPENLQLLRNQLKNNWIRNLNYLKNSNNNIFELIFKYDENGQLIEQITTQQIQSLFIASLLFSSDEQRIFNKEYYKLACLMKQEQDNSCPCVIL